MAYLSGISNLNGKDTQFKLQGLDGTMGWICTIIMGDTMINTHQESQNKLRLYMFGPQSSLLCGFGW